MSRRSQHVAFLLVLLCLCLLQISTPLPDIHPVPPLDALVRPEEIAENTNAFARDLTAHHSDSRAALNQDSESLFNN